MNQRLRNTILVTGGGSGIGRGLAEEFLKRGNTVIIAGRQQHRLEAVCTANPGMHFRALDISDAEEIARFAREIVVRFPALDTLINNAGMSPLEDLCADDVDVSAAEQTIVTNLLGTIRLTRALLPHFRAQASAAITNVTSALAFVPFAATPTYCATKAALHSYTFSLRHQLRHTNIRVTEIIPPYVQTALLGEWQAVDPRAMPLDAFIGETMRNFDREPTAPENRVEMANFLRYAEREGRFDQAFEALNSIQLFPSDHTPTTK